MEIIMVPPNARAIFTFLVSMMLMFDSIPAKAQEEQWQNYGSRGEISFSGFITDFGTDFRLDGQTDRGTDLKLEDDLNLDKSLQIFRVDGYWRFGDRHRIDGTWYQLSRRGSTTIDRQLTIGDETYDIDTSLSSKVDIGIIKADYTYLFLQTPRYEIGGSLGVHILNYDANFSALNVGTDVSFNTTLPVPTIGVRGSYAISDRWNFHASVDLLPFKISNTSGLFTDIVAIIEFELFPNAALGIGYNILILDVKTETDRLNADLDWKHEGVLAYLSLRL
jgi:hypothetical protein